ncbi:hypothetical protein U7230_11910 [Carboxydochorda subterranea]|uniref:Glucosamine-6-phosphate deaminase n=1 Tax=Carboxydichorda subterranea TaxID=3109565 RepID=A0ABZ1BXG4_9FIRM|nr:hypothetical protein [Limnochorda sp. L945t]WRP16783.1 hypothetical protein U7230_11910 [Limnochorda sp. L945t]
MAYSAIDAARLEQWLRVGADRLPGHPEARIRLQILPTPEDVHRHFAQSVFDEIAANNREGRPTRLIVPCGPREPIPILARMVNERRLSLRNVHLFHMDEHLDWQGRPYPLDSPWSFEGWWRRHFYDVVDPELNVPESQRHFPSPYDLDGMARAIDAAGGIDTAYGGIGFHGHIAYNEPPLAPWPVVSAEQFRQSTTRIVSLNVDTIIAMAQREAGGAVQLVPTMAITLGMREILAARRIRLYSTTGAWKQTALRIALFGPVTVEYPVTFLQEHPDALIVVDRATAEPPEWAY